VNSSGSGSGVNGDVTLYAHDPSALGTHVKVWAVPCLFPIVHTPLPWTFVICPFSNTPP
jgi:hypothetical protein